MKKQGHGFKCQSDVSRNIQICVSRILNLCKSMKILVILTRIMKMQVPQRNVITYNLTRFLIMPTVHDTLLDLDESCISSNRICWNDMLIVGPTLQQYSFSFFLRFITYQIAFTADIARNCRKVKIRQDDRILQ